MAANNRGATTISITLKFHRESSSSQPSYPNFAKVTTRHCAFCLEIITTFPVKLCGGCKKRAYCSKKCQVADWKITGTGQRHKNWCGVHNHGEEDVDWEVVPIPNKGLGIIAKKLLPAGYRIIVEPAFSDPNDHPGIANLEPEGSPLDVKAWYNGVLGYRDKPLIAVRISRVNHSCQPNSGVCYDGVACVEILFAQRDIQPGEEITICYYTHFNNLGPSTQSRPDIELIQSQHPSKDDFAIYEIMLKRWGITCPKECFCKNRKTRKLVTKGKRLYDEMHVSTAIGRIEDALDAGEKILEIFDQLNISWALKGDLLFHFCKIAMHNRDLFPRCRKHLAELHKIHRAILPFVYATTCEEYFKKKENVDT